jgi:fructosamine-3-kinase
MAGLARAAGSLPMAMLQRLERLAARLDTLLEEPPYPSLLHGDLWTGNVLVGRGGRIAGFVDPAIYFGHPEIELAFGTLFGTFGAPFFRRYAEQRPLTPGFFELRRDLYNLYPLLVHVCLFGAGYLGGIERTLGRLGL